MSEFENNLSKTLSEKEWQNFIYENFRLLFPEFIKIDKEKKLTTIDQDTKYIDFILQNDTTELLLEIKLPNAKIMSDSKDRNNHYLVSGVTKAILQLQRYISSYRAEIFKTSKEKYLKALLLIGEDKNTDIKQNNDWNLARNMYKDIDIITYT
nr:Shedu anti-phage system protein SduA domain-containing protein [Shimazuella kribbensis]